MSVYAPLDLSSSIPHSSLVKGVMGGKHLRNLGQLHSPPLPSTQPRFPSSSNGGGWNLGHGCFRAVPVLLQRSQPGSCGGLTPSGRHPPLLHSDQALFAEPSMFCHFSARHQRRTRWDRAVQWPEPVSVFSHSLQHHPFISQSLRGTRWGLTYTYRIWVQLTTDKYTVPQSPLLWRDPCVDHGPGTGKGATASQPLHLLDMLSP